MQITILYIGRDAKITNIMMRLLNARTEWRGFSVCTDDEAILICKEQDVDLALLGNGINQDDEEALKMRLHSIKPNLKIIQHYGGGSGLLYGEIMEAL